jgi:hypothetical protein
MTMRRRAPSFFKPLATLPFLALMVTALLGLPTLLARAEPVQPTPAKFVSPGDMNTGALLLKSGEGLVAIDTTKSGPDGKVVTTAELPLNLPEGWVYDKVYGRPTGGALRAASQYQRKLDPAGLTQAVSNLGNGLVATAEPMPAPPPQVDTSSGTFEVASASDTAGGVAKPQETSPRGLAVEPPTRNDMRQIGMFVLLLIILSAVTLLLSRHDRRDYASPRRIGRRI